MIHKKRRRKEDGQPRAFTLLLVEGLAKILGVYLLLVSVDEGEDHSVEETEEEVGAISGEDMLLCSLQQIVHGPDCHCRCLQTVPYAMFWCWMMANLHVHDSGCWSLKSAFTLTLL